jgi:formylglycine-generating enzyme required for sulfatase activity
VFFFAGCGGDGAAGSAAVDAASAADAPPDAGASSDAAAGEAASDAPDAAIAADAGTEDAPGPTTSAPSCTSSGPGLSDCGVAKESCCTSLPVIGGTYFRAYTTTADAGTTEHADPATVSSLRLDKYDVTVGRFRQYVSYLVSGGVPPAPGSGKHAALNGGRGLTLSTDAGAFESGWDASWSASLPAGSGAKATWDTNLACDPYASWTPAPGDNERKPAACVSWIEAYAFCIWDGGFLPTNAERGYAAAGGSEQREYPWGSSDPDEYPDYAIWECNYPMPTGWSCSKDSLAPVGMAAKGAGRWGQLDLVGNVWQVELDGVSPYAEPCVDCVGPPSSAGALIAGGSYVNVRASMQDGYVTSATSPMRSSGTGFRCARSL